MPRLKWGNGLRWLIFIFIFFLYILYRSLPAKENEDKIKYLETEINELKSRLNAAKNSLLKPAFENITYSSTFTNIPIDPFLNLLPHLQLLAAQHPGINLNPTFFSQSNRAARSFGRLVIGIPTIFRSKKNYLYDTIQNCLDNLRPEEVSLVTFVVMIAEREADKNVNDTVDALINKFKNAIEDGILQIIMPPSFWYPPDLDFVEPTFNDKPERMIWRTKQNLDYAYLMSYSKYYFGFTDYYVQLEDDVISKMGYISAMILFADAQKNWFTCDFSKLGFIGKLIRTNDLPLLSNFILLFYREKPVDWILDQLFLVKYCNHEEGGCIKKRINGIRRLYYKPALWQHIGRFSSLSGKVQRLKDPSFKLKTQIATPLQHSKNKNADQLSSDVSFLTLDSLQNFYNYSTPLQIFNHTTADDDTFSLQGTTLLKIIYFNPIEISSIGLRFFARYRHDAPNKLPFNVNICDDENDCFIVDFPHILHTKVTFEESKNVSSITVSLEQVSSIELLSLTSLLIT